MKTLCVYARVHVSACACMRVRVYALAEPGLQVPGSVWDYGAWRAAHLDAFVRMCADFSTREFPPAAQKGQ